MKIIKYPAYINEIIEIPYYSAIDRFLNIIGNSIPFTEKTEPSPTSISKVNGKTRVSECTIDFTGTKVSIGDNFSELIFDNIKMFNVYVISLNNNIGLCQLDWFEMT